MYKQIKEIESKLVSSEKSGCSIDRYQPDISCINQWLSEISLYKQLIAQTIGFYDEKLSAPLESHSFKLILGNDSQGTFALKIG